MIEANKQFNSNFKNQLHLNYPDANHKFHPPNNNLPSNILPNNSNKIPLNELGPNNLKIPNNPSLDNRMNSSANNIQNPYLRSSQNDRNNASMNKSTNYFEKSSTNNDFTPNLTETGPSMRNANDFSCSKKGAKKKKNEARPSQNINSNWDDKELDYIYESDESEENHYSDKINKTFSEIEQSSLNSNCLTNLRDVTWKRHEDIDVDVLPKIIFKDFNQCIQYSYEKTEQSIIVIQSMLEKKNRAINFVFPGEKDKIHVLYYQGEEFKKEFIKIEKGQEYKIYLQRIYEINLQKNDHMCGIYLFFGIRK